MATAEYGWYGNIFGNSLGNYLQSTATASTVGLLCGIGQQYRQDYVTNNTQEYYQTAVQNLIQQQQPVKKKSGKILEDLRAEIKDWCGLVLEVT